jgi:antitoxin (DNA-binding transcriptional repressor) of toxin-antitoxin stability system
MSSDDPRIGVTEFKSRCLALVDDVAQGRISRLVLTKRNKPVAVVTALPQESDEIWGAMKGSVRVAAGVDLTDPIDEVWKANE